MHTIKKTEPVRVKAAELENLKENMALNAYQEAIFNLIEGLAKSVPAGTGVKMVHGRGGVVAWYAWSEKRGFFTHRWDGRKWEKL